MASDKAFWHRYVPFYEPYFAKYEDAQWVLEYGVAHGASISYLSGRFAKAKVVGCDILSPLPDWPVSPRIEYVTLDQGDNATLVDLFERFPEPFDVVIEDGSHEPVHQRNCLVLTLPHVRPGGIYVLEDLHTSHPAYPYMSQTDRGVVNCYHLLLCFEHLLATAKPLTATATSLLARNSLFSFDEVRALFSRTQAVQFYRRAVLPLSCYRCGSSEYAYDQLRCSCGTELMEAVDSISAVITTCEPV
jgi:SAM-dependent methyltransferase